MKKNKMMRTASGLLALTLLTTGVISGTFAKYTTEDSAYDVARVAKWGVTLQATGSLYGEKYLTGTPTGGNTPTDADDGFSVESLQLGNGSNEKGEAVVAPGTENTDGFSFALNGRPEVKSNVELNIKSANIMLKKGTYGVMVANNKVNAVNFDSLVKDGLYTSIDEKAFTKIENGNFDPDAKYYTLEDKAETQDYYPVVYTLTDKDGKADVTGVTNDENSIDAVAKAIAGKIGQGTLTEDANNDAKYTYTVNNTYDPNVDLGTTIGLSNEKISWKWAFTDKADEVGNSASVDDKADTILGNLMAEVVALDSNTNTNKTTFDGIVVLGTDDKGYNKVDVKGEKITVSNKNNGEEKEFINYYAYCGEETNVVANLSTYFYIDIIVTQED